MSVASSPYRVQCKKFTDRPHDLLEAISGAVRIFINRNDNLYQNQIINI
jgi:hypothetical protein